jgi:hypothetical protein
MSNDDNLRDKARALILVAKILKRPPDRMWGGTGTGAWCILCSERVKRGEVGLEIEYEVAGKSTTNYHIHVACYSALESERYEVTKQAASDGASADGGLQSRASP